MEDQAMLVWGLVFGSVGMGYAVYGKKQSRPVALFAGVGLMAGPYLVSSVSMLLLVSAGLLALPFFLKF